MEHPEEVTLKVLSATVDKCASAYESIVQFATAHYTSQIEKSTQFHKELYDRCIQVGIDTVDDQGETSMKVFEVEYNVWQTTLALLKDKIEKDLVYFRSRCEAEVGVEDDPRARFLARVDPFEDEVTATASSLSLPRKVSTAAAPEADHFIQLYCLIYLFDRKDPRLEMTAAALIEGAVLHGSRSRASAGSLYQLAAKALSLLVDCYEQRPYRDPKFYQLSSNLSCLLIASERGRKEMQLSLIDSLLRLLRVYKLNKRIALAADLLSEVTIPKGASDSDHARFLYYKGRVEAMLRNYAAASECLLQAMSNTTDAGNVRELQTWIFVVELCKDENLTPGDLTPGDDQAHLRPYVELRNSLSDLASLNEVIKNNIDEFKTSHTITLVMRLRHRLIAAIAREISEQHPLIFFSDVAKELEDSDEDIDVEAIATWVGQENGIREKMLEDLRRSFPSVQSSTISYLFASLNFNSQMTSEVLTKGGKFNVDSSVWGELRMTPKMWSFVNVDKMTERNGGGLESNAKYNVDMQRLQAERKKGQNVDKQFELLFVQRHVFLDACFVDLHHLPTDGEAGKD